MNLLIQFLKCIASYNPWIVYLTQLAIHTTFQKHNSEFRYRAKQKGWKQEACYGFVYPPPPLPRVRPLLQGCVVLFAQEKKVWGYEYNFRNLQVARATFSRPWKCPTFLITSPTAGGGENNSRANEATNGRHTTGHSWPFSISREPISGKNLPQLDLRHHSRALSESYELRTANDKR